MGIDSWCSENPPACICKPLSATLPDTEPTDQTDQKNHTSAKSKELQAYAQPNAIAAHLPLPDRTRNADRFPYKKLSIFAPVKKWFNILLAVYLLILSCMPCGDTADCNATAQTTIQATQDHSQHNHDTETCTPFCHCNCCGNQVFNMLHQNTLCFSRLAFHEKLKSIYKVNFASQFLASIWQPPQLS